MPKKKQTDDTKLFNGARKRQSAKRGKSPTNNPLCNAIRSLFIEAAKVASAASSRPIYSEKDKEQAERAAIVLLTIQDCALMMDQAAIALAGKLQA